MHFLQRAAVRLIGELLRHGGQRGGGKRGSLGRRTAADKNRKTDRRDGKGHFYRLHIWKLLLEPFPSPHSFQK
jgi:hypothetical protein